MKNRRVHSGAGEPRHLWRQLLPPAARRALASATVLALLMVAFASAPIPLAYAAGSVTVSTTNDAVDGNTSSISALSSSPGADGKISLREAILASNNTASTAAGPNTINLPAGTYNLGNVGTVELQVGTATSLGTSIVGAGAASTIIHQTIANQRVFDLDANTVGGVTVNISKVTISGGTGTAFGGGGILAGWTGDNTNLDQVIITGNTTAGGNQGGGIGYGGGGNLTITNSIISNNSSDQIGGGIAFNQSTNIGNLTITNSTISNNTVTNIHGLGGGLLITGNNTATINNSTFSGNSIAAGGADAQGGAIQVSGGTLNMSFSRIVGNSAGSGSGSGLYKAGGATANVTNNWWGCNGGPGAAGCDAIANGAGTSSFNPWIVLGNTASPNPIDRGQSTTLTASVLKNSAGTALTAAQVSALIGLPISWGGALNGTLSSQQATIQANGTATATFTNNNTCNNGSANATVDNATATATVTVQCLPDLAATKANNVSGSAVVGQSWTWTITVNNGGGASASFSSGQTILTDNLPNSASISYGSPSASLAGVSCAITTGKDLSCTASSAVTLAPAAAFTVQFTAVASAAGSYGNPRGGGSCGVDPSGLVAESNESNNACSNSVTVNKASTTTTITADTPEPSVVGQAVTVSYNVAVNGPGAGTPSGNVTVSAGGDSCTGTVAAGQCTLTCTSAGAKTLAAQYGGDSNFSGSTSAPEPHTVNKAGTTTTIISDNPDPSDVGQAVTVQYQVTASSPGAGTPSGNVTVSDGVDSCTGTVAAGQCTITFTSAGNKSLTATYAGDSNFNTSTSAGEPHTVNGIGTTTTITSDSPDPSVVGQAVTVQYSVAPTSGSGTPTGNVTVSDGMVSCTGTVAAGQCSLTFTSAGARSLTATYAGDASFSGSTSAAEPHQVNPADTTTTITSDNPDPSAGGQAVMVQYNVTVNSPGAGTPSGNVTVSDGVDSCTGTVAAGSCSITLTTGGARTLTVTYAGDSNFNTSTSASEPHFVDNIPPSVTINQASGQADPTGISPIHFTAVFAEPVTGFTSGEVTLSGTAGATSAVVTEIAPNNGTTYDVAVSGMTSNGTVIASIPANVTTDAVGNGNTASTSTDNTVTFLLDSTPPDTTITASPTNPTNSTSASFSFTGSDNQTPPASLTFECQLDGGGFTACSSPKSYSSLAVGSHTFQVQAKDAAGNVDPTPASFTWKIHAATALLYNGAQIVNVGTTFQPAAKLSSTAAACVSGQTVSFSLDRNPLTGAAGSYSLGTATTNSSGQATVSPAIGTTGWQEGAYDLTAAFAGTASCDPSSDEATLTVASPGEAANGGGWYTLSSSGRINFGFTARKVDSTCTSNCADKGQLLLINNDKWRLKGTLTTYSKTSTGNGAASGTGDLYWWDTSLNGGLGGWALAQSGVSFTINFFDSGKSGKSSTDTFGIRIVYTPVSPPQPSTLPNSTPQVLKGGDIKVS